MNRKQNTVRRVLGALIVFLGISAEPAAPNPTPRKLSGVANTYPFWSSDGSRMVFESNRNGNLDLYAMNADGSGLVRLTDHPAADRKPAWSPDGTKIVFQSQRDGNEEIYLMNADGTGQVNLTRHPAAENHPYWSTDGSRIVFNSDRDTGETDEVYTMKADGTGVERITRNELWDTYASFSPDGTRFVLHRMLPAGGTRPDGGNSEVFVINADGSGAVNLTNHPSFDGYPAWSPDGKRIAFASNRTGAFRIWVMNADGTGLTALTSDQEGQNSTKPGWSRDGQRIAFARSADGDVHVYTVDVPPRAESAEK
jgi:Tol biopolymer transport system component